MGFKRSWAYTSEENLRFICYDSQGWEPGNWVIVKRFLYEKNATVKFEDHAHAICSRVPHLRGTSFNVYSLFAERYVK